MSYRSTIFNRVKLYIFSHLFFFFNATATTEIYTLSLHDALPICLRKGNSTVNAGTSLREPPNKRLKLAARVDYGMNLDRKSTRLNSSHSSISYAVFCLKKKKTQKYHINTHLYFNLIHTNQNLSFS